MRVYLHLSPNTQIVPFNYQPALVGAFHRWLGENKLHDSISLYSLSWLTHGRVRKGGLDFPGGSTFFVSAPDAPMLAELLNGVQQGWQVRWGMEVKEVTIQRTPDFGDRHRFLVQSPVLVQRRDKLGRQKYYFPGDERVDDYLTETLRHKLSRLAMNEEVEVSFDPEYAKPKTKLVDYKGIKIRAAACPVIVSGHPRNVAFAWEVGVGNSTGIGFGALL